MHVTVLHILPSFFYSLGLKTYDEDEWEETLKKATPLAGKTKTRGGASAMSDSDDEDNPPAKTTTPAKTKKRVSSCSTYYI